MIFFDLGDIKGDSRMKYIYTAVYLLFQMRTMYLILMFMISKNLKNYRNMHLFQVIVNSYEI